MEEKYIPSLSVRRAFREYLLVNIFCKFSPFGNRVSKIVVNLVKLGFMDRVAISSSVTFTMMFFLLIWVAFT